MQSKLRDLSRYALGCPSIRGSWPLLAKNHREFRTEPNR